MSAIRWLLKAEDLTPCCGVAVGIGLGAVLWSALIIAGRLLAPWRP